MGSITKGEISKIFNEFVHNHVEKDFKSDFISEGILYHYTRIKAIEKILIGKKLRLTNAYFLNDSQEIIYTRKLLTGLCEKKYSNHKNFVNKVNNLVEKLNKSLSNVYIFSLSESEDSLSLWSNYSSNEGYSVGFQGNSLIQNLLEYWEQQTQQDIYYRKVIYERNLQEEKILVLLKILFNFYSDFKGHADFNELFSTMFSFTKNYFLFFKSHVFNSEEEYRIVFHCKNNLEGVKHEISRGFFVPYIEVPFVIDFEKSYDQMPVKEIYIGPKNNSEIAKKGLESFLQSLGCLIEIKTSKIPLRF